MYSYKNHNFVYIISMNIALKLDSQVELGFSGFSSFSISILDIFFFGLFISMLLFERKDKIPYKGLKNTKYYSLRKKSFLLSWLNVFS